MNRLPWDKILAFTPFDLVKLLLSAGVILVVTKVQLVSDRMSALLIALPLMSVVAMVWMHYDGQSATRIANHAEGTFWFVLPTLPMFLVRPWLLRHGWGFWPAMLAGLVVCAAIGFLNGWLTIRFAIPSFITTLGMLFMARSMTVVISGGFPPLLKSDEIPSWLFVSFVGPGDIFRSSFLWFLGIAVLVSLLLGKTNFGNWVRATGGFLPAANAMGIPTARVKIACFMICSVLAGFAGVLQVLRIGSPLPSIGEGLELVAVAAAVIGGTSLLGGVGSIIGGIIGVTLIRVIDNGMVLSHVDSNWFKFAVGALTILAVVGNSWLRKRGHAMKVET